MAGYLLSNSGLKSAGGPCNHSGVFAKGTQWLLTRQYLSVKTTPTPTPTMTTTTTIMRERKNTGRIYRCLAEPAVISPARQVSTSRPFSGTDAQPIHAISTQVWRMLEACIKLTFSGDAIRSHSCIPSQARRRIFASSSRLRDFISSKQEGGSTGASSSRSSACLGRMEPREVRQSRRASGVISPESTNHNMQGHQMQQVANSARVQL